MFFCYRGRPSALLDPAAVVADPRRDYNRAFVLRFAKKNSPWPSAERSRLAQAARGGRERGARGPRPRAPARRARRVLLSSRIAFIISLHTSKRLGALTTLHPAARSEPWKFIPISVGCGDARNPTAVPRRMCTLGDRT